jgi:EAL domain-containing protein (putative c-di-GMP-specific phosphodiesterase class I)
LSYLLQMPIDVIKVDRSFIGRLSEGGLGDSIMQAILALAKTLGASVTAEGVETLQQAATLQAMSCHNMQGYLFSQPVAAELIPDLARRHWSLAPPRSDAAQAQLPPSPALDALG